MMEISPLHPETWDSELHASERNARGIAWAINPDTFEVASVPKMDDAPMDVDMFDWLPAGYESSWCQSSLHPEEFPQALASDFSAVESESWFEI